MVGAYERNITQEGTRNLSYDSFQLAQAICILTCPILHVV
jgi:hypothetical protein